MHEKAEGYCNNCTLLTEKKHTKMFCHILNETQLILKNLVCIVPSKFTHIFTAGKDYNGNIYCVTLAQYGERYTT